MTVSKLGLFSLAVVLTTACSSSPSNPDGGGNDGGNPPPSDGGRPKADGGDSGTPTVDISGMTDMTITVQEYGFGMAMPVAMAGVDVRVESTTQNGYIDGTTDQSGVAHIKVDTSKGPFDATIAKAGYTAVSVLGLKGPLATPIVTSKTGASMNFKQNNGSGSITGKIGMGNKVQLDSYWWQTVVTTNANYNTVFQSANMGNSPPWVITALEADGTGKVVNAYQFNPGGMRPNMNTTGINFPLPGSAAGFTTANVSVNWPTQGVLKGSDVTQVGDPVNDMHLGAGAIVVKEVQNPLGQMFVGVADTAIPVMNKSNVKIQAGTGAFAPDYWQASYRTNNYVVFVRSVTLNDGGSFQIGDINKLDAMGMTLDDTVFNGDAPAYDALEFLLVSQDAMGNGYASWTMLSAGGSLTAHKIPHLPKAVKLADITGGGSPDGRIVASKYQGGTTAPWSEYNKPVSITVLTSIGALDPGSRP